MRWRREVREQTVGTVHKQTWSPPRPSIPSHQPWHRSRLVDRYRLPTHGSYSCSLRRQSGGYIPCQRRSEEEMRDQKRESHHTEGSSEERQERRRRSVPIRFGHSALEAVDGNKVRSSSKDWLTIHFEIKSLRINLIGS
jgi:hypothetical protein